VTVVRYWAAARAAAGTSEETYDAASLAEVVELAGAAHGEGLARVLRMCAFVVDGNPVGVRPHESIELEAGSVVEVLPPFAGG
jgi:molybdopterin synthase sulfur carrier subunit